ncbi:MAG: hypothetical protein ACHBNF_19415 [Chromatiales bacterium]
MIDRQQHPLGTKISDRARVRVTIRAYHRRGQIDCYPWHTAPLATGRFTDFSKGRRLADHDGSVSAIRIPFPHFVPQCARAANLMRKNKQGYTAKYTSTEE